MSSNVCKSAPPPPAAARGESSTIDGEPVSRPSRVIITDEEQRRAEDPLADDEAHEISINALSEPFSAMSGEGATLEKTRGVYPRVGPAPPGPPVEAGAREGPLPASLGQQRMWFIAQLSPGSPAYNEPFLVTMPGPLDAAVLAQSLTEITRRHEAWRTVFTTVDGLPVQQIQRNRPFRLSVVDLTNLPPEQREIEAKRLAVSHARLPFDLRKGPLVRALLIRLTEADARLVVTAHHIVVDSFSFYRVVLPELHALYVAFSRGEPSPLPELSVQYADFAAWQRRRLTEEELSPRLAYWRAHLAGLTELSLPADHPRPSQLSEQGARVKIALPAELMEKLRDLGHRAGVTLFTTLLAAWKTLLFRYTGQGDIVVGSAAAGRSRPELEPLIGFFVNNLVLRTHLDGSLTFLSLLSRVGEVVRAAREHQDVPFDRLITELQVERSLNKSALYNTVFNLAPRLAPLREPPAWSVSRFDIGTAKLDLYLALQQLPSGLVGHLEYQTALFCPSTIERMIGHFHTLLEGVVRDPEQRLSELPLLTGAEKWQLSVFQGPAVAPRPDSEVLSLEQLFEAQAARSPAAIAVAHGHERLTYEELNRRANQLAHYLRSQGVGPDCLVGLCIERSVSAMVGILGVLKAGGAYVPLDPDYPSERLRFVLEDADIQLLLTDRKSAGSVQHRGRTVLLDEDWAAIGQHGADNPAPVAAAGDLAYVIYTSGSTGRPKGVLVERRGLYYLAKAQERMFGLGVGSRVLSLFSLNFDGSVWDFTLTWPVGGTLVLADQAALLPGSSLTKLLRDEDIHVVQVTPSTLTVTPYQELPALHTLICAGEPLSEDLVKQWAVGRRFLNGYGPTENTVAAVMAECRTGDGKPRIGRPLGHVQICILDSAMRPVPVGIPGELYIGGPALARGYLNRPDLTAAAFVSSPFSATAGTRLYKTGDRGKWCPDGSIEYLGRIDHQIKLRGFRIELGEIEAELDRHPAVQMAAVRLSELAGDKRLIAYVVPSRDAPEGLSRALKEHLRERLPEYMVPATFVTLDRMPLDPNGKIDRARLPAPSAPTPSAAPASTPLEQAVAAAWQEVLGVDGIGVDAPFFEVGGNSLALARVQAKLVERVGVEIDIMTLMRLPTIRQLAAHLATMPELEQGAAQAEQDEQDPRGAARAASPVHPQAIAIIGMAIRAPGIKNPEELWEVVRAGRETIRVLDPEALIAAGADPGRVRRPEFVPAEGVLDDTDRFDAAFFGYSDADATFMDPQQRVFLECAHEALEHAGCDPARFQGRIGVFAGTGASLYWLGPVAAALRAAGSDPEVLRAQTLNAPDFLTTRVAFKLGLRGPAVTVQTACSTSLSAVHMARQSLLSGECEVALAGGVSIASLREADRGYLRAEGGIESADGHCRPFDAAASGVVRASGAAIVVMKRLSSALSDGDTIHAVVLGSAMNNDGKRKMGFTAPSEDGLAETIQAAYAATGVDPGSVQFVEAHGTGTRLGDPTEVRALTRAYRHWTDRRGFCALGSLKANLGHLDAAAGAAGLIKAALALSHGVIPMVPGFRAPNPLLDLPSSPFFVSDASLPWPRPTSPRRAGVNAMGIGGTNVHVVLEEAPKAEARTTGRPCHLLCLSAPTQSALGEVARRLGEHLADNPSLDIADVANTLAVGRTQHKYRAAMVCRDASEARAALTGEATPALSAARPIAKNARPVVFLFPGHGAQYLKMGLELYETEPFYRSEIDRCLDILREEADLDLRPLLLDQAPEGEHRIEEMQWAQPLLFTLELALARQLMAWGVRPSAMLGHSLGEYVAACVAGVLSLRDGLMLVATRGRLMDTTPPGGMLTVFTDPQSIDAYLGAGVVIGAYAPGCVVLSGPAEAIATARARLAGAGIEASGVRVSRASHSPLMHGIRDAFRKSVAEVELRPPAIPIVSNVTGKYLTAEQATNPEAWALQLCEPVRLTDGLGALLDLKSPVFIEIGPGTSLGSFLKRHPRYESGKVDIVGTLPGFRKLDEPSYAALLRGLGRAWELGVEVDWQAFHAHEQRRRIPLPTYPFEGQRYSLETTAAREPGPLDARAIAVARELGVRSVDDHPGLRPRLEALCASLVLDFFVRRLGGSAARAHAIEALRQSAGILPKFMPMIEKLVHILLHAGLAEQTATGELLLRVHQHAGRSAELSARLGQDYPTLTGLVRFMEHCIAHYDEALTGAAEPIGVLYPDGTDAFYRACMREATPYSHNDVYVTMAREAVLALVRRREGRKIRILEVGAGHGALTWPLAERLDGADVDYHFTDIGRSFLQRAEAEAERRGLSWMKMFRFDLNQAPAEQGIHDRYDVVVGLNAVHVALDLPATLRHLHSLLVPGGLLIMVELTRIEIWDDVTWGLAPGYWDVTRARGALSMDLTRWEDLLRRARFARVISVPRDTNRRKVEDHGLLIAKRALSAERTAGRAVTQPTAEGASRLAPRAEDGHRSSGAPAPDATEQLVQSVWSRLLGVSHVPVDASFFDLGGDSLLAVQFLAELRVKTGHELKMRQFAAQPTVEGLAAHLRAYAEPAPDTTLLTAPRAATVPVNAPRAATVPVNAPRAALTRIASDAAACLVPLRATGTKRPFFCVHPIGGGALCYATLASKLDPDRPFFGIQSPMLEDRSARPSSVEEMAAHYVDAVQQAQPRGPYLLGGWSFGGVIAAEMARQLKRRGQGVAHLVLLDVSASPTQRMELLRHIDSRLPALAMLPAIFTEPARAVNDRGSSRKGDLSRLSDTLVAAGQNLAIYDHHLALWRRHAPAELDVPATHFVAEERPLLGALLRSVGSGELPIRAVSTARVPGDHFSMLSGDHVRDLAAQIEDALDAAEQREGARGDDGGGSALQRDEESIRAFLQQIVARMLERDGAALVEALWTPGGDCSLIALNGGLIAGAGRIKEYYTHSYAALRDARLRLRDEHVLVVAGGQIACITAQLDSDLTYVQDSQRRSYRAVRVSWVLERQGDGWRVIHAHYSLPVGASDDAIE